MKKRILKLLGVSILLLILLIIGLYLFISSQYFIKSYLLPALSNATGSRISAENISISHFSSRIKLNKFAVRFNSQFELRGETVSFDYDFWNLFDDEIKINNLILDGVKLAVIVDQDDKRRGRSKNVKLLHPDKSIPNKKTGGGLKLNISNVLVRNSTVNIDYGQSGQKNSSKIIVDEINILIPKLTTKSDVKITYNFSFKTKSKNSFEFKCKKTSGYINCFVGENWIPERLGLSMELDDVSGITDAGRFDNEKLHLNVRFKYSDNNIRIKKFVLKDISQDNNILADINLKGDLSLSPFNAKINFVNCLLSSYFLNFAGALYGISFDRTIFNYSGNISLSEDDLLLAGKLNLSDFSLSMPGFKFFEDNFFSVSLKNDLSYNFSKKEMIAKTFNLVVSDEDKALVKLSLSDKLSLAWTDNKFSIDDLSSSVVNLNIDDFDLSILRNIVGRYCDVQLLKGTLNSKLNALIEGKSDDINIKGDFELSKGGGIFNKKQLKDLDLRQKVDLKIVSFEDIFIKKSQTVLFVNSKEAVQFKTNGKISLNKQSGTVHLEITKLFAGTLNDLPLSFIKNVLGIRELFLNGFVQFAYKDGGNEYILKSKLKGENLSFFEVKDSPDIPLISGNMEIYLIKKKDALIFKKFICNLETPKGRLGNLAVDGRLYVSGAEDKSQLKVYSEGIELRELITIFNSMAGASSINLKKVNVDTDFYLKNITYGPFLTLGCEAAVKLDKGVLNADPIYVSMNKTSVFGKVVYDFTKAGKKHFNIAANALDVDISPLLKTFDPDIYSTAKGTIKSFSVELEGKGFSLRDLESSFKGELTAVVKDISIPDNPERFDLMRLIFIPIEAIAQINSLFGHVNLPVFFTNTVKYSQDIFNRMRNLDLVYGNIYLVAKNGKIYIKHCVFKGVGNPVSRLKFNGSVGFDKSVDLNTEIKLINFFSIPLHVSGTISNPKPDYFDSIVFLEDEISGSVEKDVFGVLRLPETVLEKALYNSDILFQGAAP